MASTADNRHYMQQHHPHAEQQQPLQQRYGGPTASSHPRKQQPPPPPQQQQQQQHNRYDLTPQSSFSSVSSHQTNGSGSGPSRGNSSSSGFHGGSSSSHGMNASPRIQHATAHGHGHAPSPKPKQSQLSYLQSAPTSLHGGAPPSPISPSSPSPVEAMGSYLSLTRLDAPIQDRVTIEHGDSMDNHESPSYDQRQYQQPRKKSLSPAQHQHQQLQQFQSRSGESFDANIKPSGSSGSARSMGSHGQGHHRPHQQQSGLKQSGSTASASSSSSSRGQPPLQSSGSTGSNASQRKPALLTPASVLAIDLEPTMGTTDESYSEKDQEKHQQQALLYQQRLQQKPPTSQGDVEGDDSDADSDSSSLLSYRRSISRLSMSYKRTNTGAPNISLFAPGQRPAMLSGNHHGGSGGYGAELTGSQKMIQEQREERLRQQMKQQQQSQPLSPSQSSPGGHGGHHYPQHPMNGGGGGGERRGPPFIPERSSSADSLQNEFLSRQQQLQQQQQSSGNYGAHHNPPSPNIAHRQIPGGGHSNNNNNNNNNNNYHHQAPPRPSHESQHSVRSRPDRLNVSPNEYQGDSIPRTRSPGPGGPGGPMGPDRGVFRQNGANGSSTSLVSPGARNHPGGMNPHPAHHLASGGYVRPEEAVGPSNPMPEKAEDFVRQGIELHEEGEITKATQFFRTAAEMGDPVGMLMYGLSVRHGWGCASNRQLAFQYLQKSAEHAVGDLKSRDSFASTAAKGELVLAIYELGVCFRHGWGAEKNKKTAAYYFEIAANLGDPDAQNDLAWCFYHGVGVKKDMFKAAKYYRLAAAQGLEQVGNSWIWKDKYGGIPSSPTGE